MSGTKYIYVSRDLKIYPIPIPKDYTYKAVPELANENVLKVNFIYETKNRKPWELFYFGFMRIQLNDKGQYIHSSDDDPALYNFINYGFATAEELCKRDLITIPKAIDIPNSNEKAAIISYIKKKYPSLWENSPGVLEMSIQSRMDKQAELVNLVKKANVIKREITKNLL